MWFGFGRCVCLKKIIFIAAVGDDACIFYFTGNCLLDIEGTWRWRVFCIEANSERDCFCFIIFFFQTGFRYCVLYSVFSYIITVRGGHTQFRSISENIDDNCDASKKIMSLWGVSFIWPHRIIYILIAPNTIFVIDMMY